MKAAICPFSICSNAKLFASSIDENKRFPFRLGRAPHRAVDTAQVERMAGAVTELLEIEELHAAKAIG